MGLPKRIGQKRLRCDVRSESVGADPTKEFRDSGCSETVQEVITDEVGSGVRRSIIRMLSVVVMVTLGAGVPSRGREDANSVGASYSVERIQLSSKLSSSAKGRMSVHKDISEIVKNYSTFAAVIIGGLWTYAAFARRREKYPRAKVSHRILHRKIDDGRVFLKVVVVIQNIGEVMISLDRRFVRVQKMIPWPTEAMKPVDVQPDNTRNDHAEVEWPLLGEVDISGEEPGHEIEPGESEELHFDFVVPSETNTVVVYSYLKNVTKRKREIGWNTTSTCQIKIGENT